MNPPRKRPSLLALGALLPAFAAGGAAGTACTSECDFPSEEITVTLPDELETYCRDNSREQAIDGIFVRTDGGFALQAGMEEYAFPDSDADVPNGTFVRVVVQCLHLGGNGLGKLVILTNLPEIEGEKNPTEGGTRLWFAAGGGGSLILNNTLPIDYAMEEVCHAQIDSERGRYLEAMIPFDGARGTVVRPGETRAFSIARGEHAGSYELDNVNIVFSEDDDPVRVNFRIRRAD